MRYGQDFLQQIRDRIPVSEVARRSVTLRRAGGELKGLSPFNKERTPSFFVNDAKQFYHCFSSGKHGDVFSFLMEAEGLSFPEAVEQLAAEAGLALPSLTQEQQAGIERRDGLHAVMELAVSFYERTLASGTGDEARAYLRDVRGVDDAAVATFRIGYAPRDRYALRRHLAGLGIDIPTMAEVGLVGPDGDGPPRDRFVHRVVCPIMDSRGRPVAFGGRSLNPANPAKYLNSPETPLFHKGGLLYNHHRAKAAGPGLVIAVEGYLDVVALEQHGIARVVSPLGTAVTREQAALLWEMSVEPVVALDGDAAGRRAALRLAHSALPHLEEGRSLRFALLPEGVDPDRLVRDGGRAAMEGAVARSIPLLDLIWQSEASVHALNSPERLARMEGRMGALLSRMPDGALRRRYAREVSGRIDALGRRPHPALVRRTAPEPTPPPAVAPDGPQASPLEAALAVLASRPALLARWRGRLPGLDAGTSAPLRDALLAGGGAVPASDAASRAAPGDRWMFRPGADPRSLARVVAERLLAGAAPVEAERILADAERAYADNPSDAGLARLRAIQSRAAAVPGDIPVPAPGRR